MYEQAFSDQVRPAENDAAPEWQNDLEVLFRTVDARLGAGRGAAAPPAAPAAAEPPPAAPPSIDLFIGFGIANQPESAGGGLDTSANGPPLTAQTAAFLESETFKAALRELLATATQEAFAAALREQVRAIVRESVDAALARAAAEDDEPSLAPGTLIAIKVRRPLFSARRRRRVGLLAVTTR